MPFDEGNLCIPLGVMSRRVLGSTAKTSVVCRDNISHACTHTHRCELNWISMQALMSRDWKHIYCGEQEKLMRRKEWRVSFNVGYVTKKAQM